MRQARIRGGGLSYNHCLSRVVDRQFIQGDAEREHFVILIRKLQAFLGLRVITYAVVIISAEEYERSLTPRKSLVEALRACPQDLTTLVGKRSKQIARKVDFG